MAKLCSMCGTLCVFLVLLIRISKALSDSDKYFYQTDNVHIEHSTVEFLEDKHSITRRESPRNTTQEAVTAKPIKGKIQKTVWKNVTDKDTVKNLGENGSGQRKYYPTTEKTLVTRPNDNPKPLPPLIHNTNGTDLKNDTEDDEIAIAKFSDQESLNKTLSLHNLTIVRTDTHLYYNSTFKTDEKTGKYFWVDMNNRSDVKINDLLSGSHRRAATIKLSFEFPFYGHLIKSVTIATGGFLYTGDYVHSWLAATQYIAPLMANFDTSLSNDSFIKYVDNGTAFTVQWEKVSLQEKPREGFFTFQVTLHNTGDIVFVYQNVPVFIENIQDEYHPVKVGLSDAYIMDRTIFFVRRKTIYEYHRVNFKKEEIKNWTVIYLKALPTCLDNKDCETCLSKEIPSFHCSWCPSVGRCSSGLDRHRQDWVTKGCEKKHLAVPSSCSHVTSSDIFDNEDSTYNHDVNSFEHFKNSDSRISDASSLAQQNVKMGISGIVAILFLVGMVSGLAFWVLYAYRNPHTTSGQILIRYRPSQWRWRRGEARYTAATIHM